MEVEINELYEMKELTILVCASSLSSSSSGGAGVGLVAFQIGRAHV